MRPTRSSFIIRAAWSCTLPYDSQRTCCPTNLQSLSTFQGKPIKVEGGWNFLTINGEAVCPAHKKI